MANLFQPFRIERAYLPIDNIRWSVEHVQFLIEHALWSRASLHSTCALVNETFAVVYTTCYVGE